MVLFRLINLLQDVSKRDCYSGTHVSYMCTCWYIVRNSYILLFALLFA